MRNTLPIFLFLALAVPALAGPATTQVELGDAVAVDDPRVVTLDITGMT